MESLENDHPLSSPRLLLNEYFGKNVEGEAMVSNHIFSYIISGSHEVWIGEKKYSFKAGLWFI